MRILLPFALLASLANAAADTLYGNFAVNEIVFGQNMTFGGNNHEQIKFAGSEDSYWFIEEVAKDVKPWHTVRKYSDVAKGHLFINFNEHKAGEVATTTTGSGSIFKFEYTGDARFRFVSIDNPDANLVWTVKNNGTGDFELYLTLEPDEGSQYQRFSILNYDINP
ncbi:hypothetical protein FQN49_002578 [Arthroderma sp. PD_2]|nr:hypothetical protein FQN49_002578 [Arthroderma sp. PD_2]